MSDLVFVFGTLKEGFPNFHINEGVRIPGIFSTQDRFPFYLVGERFSPWLMNEPGQGEYVKGQIFSVDLITLAKMDQLERITEPDGYIRETITVIANAEKISLYTVYVYLKKPEHLQQTDIRLGPISEYTLAHACMYKSRTTTTA